MSDGDNKHVLSLLYPYYSVSLTSTSSAQSSTVCTLAFTHPTGKDNRVPLVLTVVGEKREETIEVKCPWSQQRIEWGTESGKVREEVRAELYPYSDLVQLSDLNLFNPGYLHPNGDIYSTISLAARSYLLNCYAQVKERKPFNIGKWALKMYTEVAVHFLSSISDALYISGSHLAIIKDVSKVMPRQTVEYYGSMLEIMLPWMIDPLKLDSKEPQSSLPYVNVDEGLTALKDDIKILRKHLPSLLSDPPIPDQEYVKIFKEINSNGHFTFLNLRSMMKYYMTLKSKGETVETIVDDIGRKVKIEAIEGGVEDRYPRLPFHALMLKMFEEKFKKITSPHTGYEYLFKPFRNLTKKQAVVPYTPRSKLVLRVNLSPYSHLIFEKEENILNTHVAKVKIWTGDGVSREIGQIGGMSSLDIIAHLGSDLPNGRVWVWKTSENIGYHTLCPIYEIKIQSSKDGSTGSITEVFSMKNATKIHAAYSPILRSLQVFFFTPYSRPVLHVLRHIPVDSNIEPLEDINIVKMCHNWTTPSDYYSLYSIFSNYNARSITSNKQHSVLVFGGHPTNKNLVSYPTHTWIMPMAHQFPHFPKNPKECMLAINTQDCRVMAIKTSIYALILANQKQYLYILKGGLFTMLSSVPAPPLSSYHNSPVVITEDGLVRTALQYSYNPVKLELEILNYKVA